MDTRRYFLLKFNYGQLAQIQKSLIDDGIIALKPSTHVLPVRVKQDQREYLITSLLEIESSLIAFKAYYFSRLKKYFLRCEPCDRLHDYNARELPNCPHIRPGMNLAWQENFFYACPLPDLYRETSAVYAMHRLPKVPEEPLVEQLKLKNSDLNAVKDDLLKLVQQLRRDNRRLVEDNARLYKIEADLNKENIRLIHKLSDKLISEKNDSI